MSEHETDPDDALVPPDLLTDAAADPETERRHLREALEGKTREAETNWERYVRTVAEYDNTRKRAARDREEYVRTANEALLRELLPVLDNFERALQAARGDAGAGAVTGGGDEIRRGV